MRLPNGRQIKEAILQEVAAIASDLPLASMTSGSKVMISSRALTNPCHNSSNVLQPNMYFLRYRFISGAGSKQLHLILLNAIVTD